MLKSMTGYGKSVFEHNNKKVIIELKTLNSKQIDISLKIPQLYKEKEIILRNTIKDVLKRGKAELFIWMEDGDNGKNTLLNQELIKDYYKQINDLMPTFDPAPDNNAIFQSLMRFPDVFTVKQDEVSEEEWNLLIERLKIALKEVQKFRIQEGKVLELDISQRVQLIKKFNKQVEDFEEERMVALREKLHSKISELQSIEVDKERFEQEIIYYLEKIDITEEKVRLNNHCDYFLETVTEEFPIGKKLGFISQEIGREINTIGSKANNVHIQKIVVQMKDELEKIKEQLMNVL